MSDLLPPNATPQERSISLSLDRAVPVPNATLWSPWTCPLDVLPWLAWALSVDEWDAGASEATKRQIIEESIDQHRIKGTVGALKRALQTLGYDVEIREDTGVAYCFSLGFKVTGGTAGGAVMDAAIDSATAIALRQKNARSALIYSAFIAEAPGIGGPVIVALTLSGSETDCTTFDASENRVIVGTLTPDATGVLLPCGAMNGKPAWSSDGTQDLADGVLLFWNYDGWYISHFDGEVNQWINYATGDLPPNTGWSPYGGTGTPTIY